MLTLFVMLLALMILWSGDGKVIKKVQTMELLIQHVSSKFKFIIRTFFAIMIFD